MISLTSEVSFPPSLPSSLPPFLSSLTDWMAGTETKDVKSQDMQCMSMVLRGQRSPTPLALMLRLWEWQVADSTRYKSGRCVGVGVGGWVWVWVCVCVCVCLCVCMSYAERNVCKWLLRTSDDSCQDFASFHI